jgi:hypothetical protein
LKSIREPFLSDLTTLFYTKFSGGVAEHNNVVMNTIVE